MKITTTKTATGEHIAKVGPYTTPAYYTEGMAQADAACWVAFHGEETEQMAKYTLAVVALESGIKSPLNGEWNTKEEAWLAVQETNFSESVTVYEDGKGIASFNWMFKNPDEPHPTKPGYVNRVRDLCKWTRAGWVATGVQAVGIGTARFIRTV